MYMCDMLSHFFIGLSAFIAILTLHNLVVDCRCHIAKPLDTDAWELIPCSGGGHCLVYSICSSWDQQLTHLPSITQDKLLVLILLETIGNPHYYLAFLESLSKFELKKD